ncbi:MAG: phosphate ABC transporter permease PstA, partial [bacterium]
MRRFWRSGDPLIWLTGAALAFALIMVAGLITLVLANGLGFFWPKDVVRLTLRDGGAVLGEIVEREVIPGSTPATVSRYRVKVKQGNRDALGADFVWINEDEIVARQRSADATVVERREWGNLYGFLKEVRGGDGGTAQGADAWAALHARLPVAQDLVKRIRRIERRDIGAINREQERLRLSLRTLELQGIKQGPEVDRVREEMARWQARYDERAAELAALRERQTGAAVFILADGKEIEVPLTQIVRPYRPNATGAGAKAGLYAAKVWEFVAGEPRESNTEGGVFPAIFGTVMMVLIMSIVVTPLGVLAAFYLREYAKQGPFVSAVRIAVNNLAGVPSIVFGVFGVGFFIY